MPALSPEDGRIQTIRAAVEASPPTAHQSRFALVFVSDRVDGKWNRVFLASLDKGGGVLLAEMRPDDRQRGKVTMTEVGIGMVTQYKKIEAVPLDFSHDRAREEFFQVAGKTLRAGDLDVLYRYFTLEIENSGLVRLATDENGVSLAPLAGAIATLFEQLAAASQTDDARTDDASQQPATDDDQESSHAEQVAIASNTEDARTDDDARQPATDDDGDASQEEVALASDSEDAPTYAAQQPATDDNGDASQEEVALASDSEEAPADDAVMQTAKAEVVINPTLDDQAGPQLAISAPITPDDGFSFSMFPKQGVPAEVAKEGIPAEQLSHEDMPGSGTPTSESRLFPDAASVDVGNAAPSKDPVVYHGDLAP